MPLIKFNLGAMPLPSYRMVHPNSAVTPEQLGTLRKYPTTLSGEPQIATSSQVDAADREYVRWVDGSGAVHIVQSTLAGVPFPSRIQDLEADRQHRTHRESHHAHCSRQRCCGKGDSWRTYQSVAGWSHDRRRSPGTNSGIQAEWSSPDSSFRLSS